MRLYLTKQRDGSYMLTRLKPQIAQVLGTRDEDAYMQPGEPIGVRHLCHGGVLMLTAGNERVRQMEPLESIEIQLSVVVR